MKAINKHTARIADIAPGATGEVDAENATVKVMLDAGLLVDVEVERKRLVAELGASDAAEALAAENAALKARLAELEAAALKTRTPKPPKGEG